MNKFSQLSDTDEIICPVNMNEILKDSEEAYSESNGLPVIKNYRFDGTTYSVNIGSVRYMILNRDERKCICCGIHGTSMYLAKHQKGFHFRVYAENKNDSDSDSDSDSHFTLLTNDHIIPKSKGGTEDPSNLQCLCIHCNRLKKTLT